MTRRFLPMILIAAAQFPALMASTYTVVLDQSAYFAPAGAGFSLNRFTASVVPAFIADFGVDKTLEITYSAPAGYHFRVDAPPAANVNAVLNIEFGLPEAGGPNLNQTAGTVGFGGASGDVPDMPPPTLSVLEGTLAVFSQRLLSGGFTFSSVTLTIPVGAAYNAGIASDLGSPVILVEGTIPSSSPDPGQWAFLEADPSPAPEPSCTSLFLCGLSLIALGHRRKRRIKN